MYKCTLCVDRVAVGLQPACVKACPTSCLQFGTKEAMLDVAVLAFGDRPELYGLPRDPSIPLAVRLWKGPLKWAGNAAMLGGLLGVFVHFMRFGRKTTEGTVSPSSSDNSSAEQ